MKVMKKVKILITSVLFCAMGYTGYIAYERMTMSEAEKFMLANVEALTRDESTSSLWFREDKDCVYTYTGSANKSISISIGSQVISGKFDQNGVFTYTVKDGKTHCTAGGHEQCSARYCPVAIRL